MSPFTAKVLTPLITPLGVCCMFWAIAAWLYGRGHRKWSWRLGAGGVLLLLFFSNMLVGESLLGGLEDDYPVLAPEECPAADAIVVLGGVTAMPIPPRKSVEVGEGFDRLLHALRLYRAGRAPYLVFSGGGIPELTGGHMSEAAQFKALALEYGITPEAILLEERSRNTYENALFTRQLLEERGLGRVLLVSSAAHMPRAVAVFRSQGVEVVPAPADVRVVPRPFTFLSLLPSTGGLEMSSAACREYMGWWVYRLRGWID
jgi:uncharacterized SAM-binding protein YcdF (DUF218 family)